MVYCGSITAHDLCTPHKTRTISLITLPPGAWNTINQSVALSGWLGREYSITDDYKFGILLLLSPGPICTGIIREMDSYLRKTVEK